MTGILWLVSYPKSGNTWLRFLIAHLVQGRLPPSAELQSMIPDAHRTRECAIADGSRRLVKTHWLPTRLPQAGRTAGFVYVARNPWDVIASNARFAMLCADPATLRKPAQARARLKDAYVERFIRHRGDPRWIEHGIGSWDEHLSAWREAASKVPSLFLRYEDLLERPQGEVGRLARFLGLAAGKEAIARAVDETSFGALRALEESEIRARRPGLFWGDLRDPARAAGHRFMAKAGARFGRDEFPAEQWARIAETFAAEIETLGYGASALALGHQAGQRRCA